MLIMKVWNPNKIHHKICFDMLKQNQIKDFPQNSRRAKRVVIMNRGNSMAVGIGPLQVLNTVKTRI